MSISPFHLPPTKRLEIITQVDVARQGYVVRRDIRIPRRHLPFKVFTELYQSLVGDVDKHTAGRDGMRQRMQGFLGPNQ